MTQDDIQIESIPAQHALVVHERASRASLGERMGQAFDALMNHVQATGAHVTGPWFAVYPEMPGDDFTFGCGAPVAPGATGGAGVELQELPGGDAAVLTYQGPYDGLSEQWARLMAWLESSGRTPSAPPREVYLNDPAAVLPEDLLTRLVMPLA